MEMIVNFSGKFIGTVKSYNTQTREVLVYIPKLMPGISETQNIITITNYGNSSLNRIGYNKNITFSNGIWLLPKNADDKLPNIGSKVMVQFLENNPSMGYWEKFNQNNDYSIIDSEKYDKLHTLTINGVTSEIYEDDDIEINLPDIFESVVVKDKDNKKIKINISVDTSFLDRIRNIEDFIGNGSYISLTPGLYENDVKNVDATGLMKRIETLEKEIEELKKGN